MRSYCTRPGCTGFMTLVGVNYVCDCCCASRPVVAVGAVLQYQLFSRFPVRLPSKGKKRSVEQNIKAANPTPSELFTKADLVGVEME